MLSRKEREALQAIDAERAKGLPPLPAVYVSPETALYTNLKGLFEGLRHRVEHFGRPEKVAVRWKADPTLRYVPELIIEQKAGEDRGNLHFVPAFKIQIREVLPLKDEKSGANRNKSFKSGVMFEIRYTEGDTDYPQIPFAVATFENGGLCLDQRKVLHRKVQKLMKDLDAVKSAAEMNPPAASVSTTPASGPQRPVSISPATGDVPVDWWNNQKLFLTTKPQ